MDAVYLHGPGDLRIDDVNQRDVSPEAIAVDIEYTGICGSDLHEYEVGPVPIRAEETEHSIPESDWDEYLPKPMGHEIAGTVSAIGENVDDVRTGDRVTLNMVAACHDCRYCAAGKYNLCERGDGGVVSSRGFADRIVVPSSMAVPVPDTVSLRHATLAEPLGVSLRGVSRSDLEPTDRIAVFSAGPIGLGVVTAAKVAGVREILVSEPRESRREAATALGADVVIDPTDVNPVEFIKRKTNRVDVSFECAGTGTTLTDALRSTAYGETVVVLSVFDEEVPVHPNDIMQAERKLLGSFGFQGGPLSSRSELSTVLDLIADGRIDPEPMITDTVPLDGVESAFERLRDPDSDDIKVLVTP